MFSEIKMDSKRPTPKVINNRTRARTVSQNGGGSTGNNNSISVRKTPSYSTRVNQYYAGAKFETIPSADLLPQPPAHWMVKSKSSPSSPITTGGGSTSSSSSIADSGRNTVPVFKSASFPGGSLLLLSSAASGSDGSSAFAITSTTSMASASTSGATVPAGQEWKNGMKVSSDDSNNDGHDLMKMLQQAQANRNIISSPVPVASTSVIQKSPTLGYSSSITSSASSVLSSGSPRASPEPKVVTPVSKPRKSSIVPSPQALSALSAELQQHLLVVAAASALEDQRQLSPKPCAFYSNAGGQFIGEKSVSPVVGAGQQYKDVSEHLKSLLKVCN